MLTLRSQFAILLFTRPKTIGGGAQKAMPQTTSLSRLYELSLRSGLY